MARVGEDLRPLVEGAASVVSERLNRRFVVEERADGFYQVESQAEVSDGLPFESAHRLEYVVGSGVNGFSYLARRGNHLVQAPISYYRRKAAWGLSPGYEFAKPGEDYGFNRTIHPACLQCHAGRPLPDPSAEGRYQDPPFAELAIGCENCHGPGRSHVDARLAGLGGDDHRIVHPLKLEPRLAENICMNCHQGGDARVLQPGRGHFDFRPGEWLNDSVAIFKRPLDRDSPREADLLEHNDAMSLSTCFRASGGALSCFSCHEIHDLPEAAGRPAYYREKCYQCHADSDCSLPRIGRPGNDCASCHMPKRDIAEISHSALTNHRIVRYPSQELPEEAFRRTTSDLPELVHVNRPPGAGGESIPLMVRFHAVGELLYNRPELKPAYMRLLAEAAERHGDEPLVLAALGRNAMIEKRPSDATEYYQQAVDAGFRATATYIDLANLLMEAGRLEDSAEILRDAVTVLPYAARLRKMLALRYINLKQYPAARETIREFVELFPEDDFMRKLQRQVEALPASP